MFYTMREQTINALLDYLDEGHKNNLHTEAFHDTANVFLDFVDCYTFQEDEDTEGQEERKQENWVCNSSPGHGKTTVLKCMVKMLMDEKDQKKKIPLLLAFRDLEIMNEVFDELRAYKKTSVVMVDAENRKEVEEFIRFYQVVIISHKRLENLALGFGNKYEYLKWHQHRVYNPATHKFEKPIAKKERLLIVDEMPTFVTSATFDIIAANNSLDWYDELSAATDLNAFENQTNKSYITTLIASELALNTTSVTKKLLQEGNRNSAQMILLQQTLERIENETRNSEKIDSLLKLKAFKKLLTKDGVGRIDSYRQKNSVGRKIIVAERIDYSKAFKLSTLILDGTAHVVGFVYKGYSAKPVNNYNNYTRLKLSQRQINTSKNNRQKSGKPVQTEILYDILSLRDRGYQDLFVLPMKDDIDFYLKGGAIAEAHQEFFIKEVDDETNPVNLLNTTGKNFLKDTSAMYLTSLPRMHPDFYKHLAISLYGHDVDLNMGNVKGQWFDDPKSIFGVCVLSYYRSFIGANLEKSRNQIKLRYLSLSKMSIKFYF